MKVKKEKTEQKELLIKKKINKEKKKLTAKKLPFYSKERLYERDLKIMAVDESKFKSSQIPE